jgi:hypothetical protein
MNSIEAKLRELTRHTCYDWDEMEIDCTRQEWDCCSDFTVPDANDQRWLIDELRASLTREKVLRECLEFYSKPRHMGCTKDGDHDDPSWCNESCGDYGKRARSALAAISNERGEG